MHFCGNGVLFSKGICQTVFRVSSTRYLGLTFDNNMRWHLHVNNIVMRLRTLSFSFYKLRAFLLVETMCIILAYLIYFALYQTIFQIAICSIGMERSRLKRVKTFDTTTKTIFKDMSL